MANWIIPLLVAIELMLLIASVGLWRQVGDPFGMVRYILRLVLVVPAATLLAIAAVILFDRLTPGDWLEGISHHECSEGTHIAHGIVVAALILAVFWLCIQG